MQEVRDPLKPGRFNPPRHSVGHFDPRTAGGFRRYKPTLVFAAFTLDFSSTWPKF